MVFAFVPAAHAAEGPGLGPADPAPPFSRTELRELLHRSVGDAKDLSTAPARWNESQWVRFGEGVALVAVVYAGDQKIADAIRRNGHGRTGRYLHNVTNLGGGLGEHLTIAAVVAGYLSNDARLMNTGLDAFESSVWAAGLITPAIKHVVGRARPIQDEGARSYHPFNAHFESFPSGHATNAFAIASAVASRWEDHPSVGIVAYAIATSVAVARVNERAHFPSDVVAGALIGRVVARSIVHNHLTIMPMRRGLAATITF